MSDKKKSIDRSKAVFSVRNKIFVNKKFQLKFILKAAIPLLLFNLLIGIGILVFFRIFEKSLGGIHSAEKLGPILAKKIAASFANSAEMFNYIESMGIILLAIIIILAFIYIFAVFLFFSHKVAGPIARFKKILEALLAGDLTTRFKLRKKDQFHETAEKANEMIISLHDRLKRIDQFNGFTLQSLQEMKDTVSKDNEKNIEKIEDLSMSISQLINEFKLNK